MAVYMATVSGSGPDGTPFTALAALPTHLVNVYPEWVANLVKSGGAILRETQQVVEPTVTTSTTSRAALSGVRPPRNGA